MPATSCVTSEPFWTAHVTIALIGAISAMVTAWLSNRNHGVLQKVSAAVNGHGEGRETWRSPRGV